MNDTFDVIVVGAGGSGAPLAARLSEDPECRVLLLEAGEDYPRTEDFPPELLDANTVKLSIPGHAADWGFTGQITPERSATVTRGKVLGGSLSVNGTYFMRNRRVDFDAWSQHGNDFWTYENALPFYRKLEADLDYGDTEQHGGSGPMRVKRQRVQAPFYQAVIAAAAELGIPEEVDKNGQQPAGVGAIVCNNPDGVRWNSGIGYINPVRARRPNLTIRGNTFVRRVLFEGRTAVGVEAEHNGEVESFYAALVVLSAGAMKTPHVLMLSGIGPPAELAAFGIPVVHASPGVGKQFSDHPNVAVMWTARSPIVDYGEPGAWSMTLNADSGEADFREDLELKFGDKPFAYILSGERQSWPHQNTIAVALQKGVSRGDMSLQSADPHVYPRFDYNYFSNDLDVRRILHGVRMVRDILLSAPMKDQVADPGFVGDTELMSDDDALFLHLSRTVVTGIHMAGTAKFAVGDDPTAVVDQYGRVLGVEGLRIADTSILPSPASRGPAATAVMIGEKMADHIKRTR